MLSSTTGNVSWGETTAFSDEIWTLSARSIVGCLFGIIVLAGFFGNALIVAAISRQIELQIRGNYLIGSLAVTDLLVCSVVAPYSAVMALHEFGPSSMRTRWLPLPAACQIFIFLDMACCTASILHLCTIAVDRYITITTMRFQTKCSFHRVLPIIVGIWMASAVLPAISHLAFPRGKSNNSSDTHTNQEVSQDDKLSCVVNTNKVYRIVATTLAFWTPLTLIIIIYWKVTLIAWKRVHWGIVSRKTSQRSVSSLPRPMEPAKWTNSARNQQRFKGLRIPSFLSWNAFRQSPTKSHRDDSDTNGSSTVIHLCSKKEKKKISQTNVAKVVPRIATNVEKTQTDWQSPLHSFDPSTTSATSKRLKNSSTTTEATFNCFGGTLSDERVNSNRSHVNCAGSFIRRTQSDSVPLQHKRQQTLHSVKVTNNTPFQHRSQSNSLTRARMRLRLRREKKIIRTIGMVIGGFVICWLPFFLKELIVPFCNSCHLTSSAEVFINWLGYANSALNPFIYGFTNGEFNKAFKKVFHDAAVYLRHKE